jgi:hypothetical protein
MRYSIRLQLPDLGGHDDTSTTTEYLDMTSIALAQRVDHEPEKLDMAALVGTDGDTLDIFLDGSRHDLCHRAIVPEVYDLYTGRLQHTPHDIDGSIVSVEQTGGRDETQRRQTGIWDD